MQQVQDVRELLLCTYLDKYSCFPRVKYLSKYLVHAVLRTQAYEQERQSLITEQRVDEQFSGAGW